MGYVIGHQISEAYLEDCGIWPMPPIVNFDKNWPCCQWYIIYFCCVLLLWVALAKIHNVQDRLLKLYALLGHPKKLVFKNLVKKYNKLWKLSTKNRVPSQSNRV